VIRTLLGLTLVANLAVGALSIHGIVQQRDSAQAAARQATEQRDTLAAALAKERSAQARLRTTQDSLRAELARRHSQIEDLKHENQELRDWAAQPLPTAARRLRERPALTGADAYQDWLSGRGAVPPSGDRAGQ
jgi:LysB family phage lysis regulatory protein